MWSTICWNPQSSTIFFCQSAVHRFFSNRPHFFKSPHSISFLNPTPLMSKLIHSSVTTEKFCSPCRLFVQKSELMILLQYSSPKLKKKNHTRIIWCQFHTERELKKRKIMVKLTNKFDTLTVVTPGGPGGPGSPGGPWMLSPGSPWKRGK